MCSLVVHVLNSTARKTTSIINFTRSMRCVVIIVIKVRLVGGMGENKGLCLHLKYIDLLNILIPRLLEDPFDG